MIYPTVLLLTSVCECDLCNYAPLDCVCSVELIVCAAVTKYSKNCLKRNAIVPVFFFSVFTGFRFTKGCVLIKQSTKNMIA
jgi:hypothetical protein